MINTIFSKTIFISLFFLLIVQVSQAKTEDASSLSAIVAKHVAEGMDTGKDLTELHKVLMEALSKKPNSPSLNYQLARYTLKTGVIQDESLAGYYYRQDTEDKTVEILKNILKQESTYAQAYSLLGHIYTIQNKVIEAEENLSKAVATQQNIKWMPFNQALLLIKKNNIDGAVKILHKLVKTRPNKNQRALQNQYYAAWNLIKKIALKEPKYDPNESIRKGHIKRVSPKNLKKYITDNKTNKLTIIHFSSNDTWCRACITNNKNMANVAKELHAKVDFIHVSFEPWQTVSHFKKELGNLFVKGLPTTNMIKQGKSLAVQAGVIESNSLKRFILKDSKNPDSDKKNTNKKSVNKKDKVLLSNKFKSAVAKLMTKKNNRAATIAIDNTGKWTFQRSYNYKDLETAKTSALSRCNKIKAERKIKSNCVLYAVNNSFVYQGTNTEVLSILKKDFLDMQKRNR